MDSPALINMNTSPAQTKAPIMGEEDSQYNGGPDDGVDDEAYSQDIIGNLEEHLNSLPEDQKQFLATYATVPEVATVLGIVNGKEVYDYFAKLADPNKTIQVMQKPGTGQSNTPAKPSMPSAPAPQPQASPSPQGQGIVNV